MNKQRNYQFIESTISLCPVCFKRVDAKIILKNGKIFVLKNCLEHGEQEEILEDDAEYYLRRMLYTKPGTISKTQTQVKNNCPFDCGLCPEHDQHTCIGLIEVTNNCDLKCPMCYANSGEGSCLSLKKISEMIDFFVDSEFGNAEILQISGGEPTTHPEIIKIIRMAREKNVKYVMLNTNGLRIAEDDDFVKELSQFTGNFEIYLQFDGFNEKVYQHLRGKKLFDIKKRAVENLNKYNIPITLVSTIESGVNDNEVGEIIGFGIKNRNIRGINFQPVAFFGRMKDSVNLKERVTITRIINEIEVQTKGMMTKKDFIPLPCNVDRVAISYLYKKDGEFIPLTRDLDIKKFLPVIRNTFKFDPEDFLADLNKNIFPSCGCCDYLSLLKKFKKIVPGDYMKKSEEEKISYISENLFRISITSFVDAYNFDMKSMKKECVHIITEDLKKMPFSAYNTLYRK